MSKNLTIKDIASLAGFSVRTVSRVINNEGYVKQETREKIQKIISETGFETNIFAKSLRKKIVRNIIVVIEKERSIHPGVFYSSMFQCIINEGNKYGYNIFMMEFDANNHNQNEKNIQLLKSGFVDGAIIFTIREEDPKINIFKKLNIPFVAMSRNSEGDFPYVVINNYKSAIIASEYLIEKGCESFIYLGGSNDYVFVQERKKGFMDTLAQNNIPESNITVYDNLESFRDAYEECMNIEKQDKPIGLFIQSDEMAFGVIKALHAKNISIPEDAMIIGFDNIPLSEFSVPSLTTMEQDINGMAKKAVEILHELTQNKSEEFETQVVFQPQLIIRESTK